MRVKTSISICGVASAFYAVIAIVGWLALADWADAHDKGEENYDSQRDATIQKISPTQQLTSLTNTEAVKTPCDTPIPNGERDLCQQWRMAEAADSMVKVSWAQLGLTSLSLLGLAITIWYTRHSNQIAREIGEAQTRAYLSCTGGTYKIQKNHIVCRPLVENNGQSPAKNIRFKTQLLSQIDQKDPHTGNAGFEDVATEFTLGGCQIVPSGTSKEGLVAFRREEINEKVFSNLRSGWASFTISGRLHWDDVFTKEQSIPVVFYQNEDRPAPKIGTVATRTGTLSAFSKSIES